MILITMATGDSICFFSRRDFVKESLKIIISFHDNISMWIVESCLAIYRYLSMQLMIMLSTIARYIRNDRR
jgi:hypothetical protein